MGIQKPSSFRRSPTVKNLFYCADLVPTKAHINFPYIMGYDNFPLTTLEEKKKYIPKFFEENWLLFLEHDPVDAMVKLEQTERGFKAVAVMNGNYRTVHCFVQPPQYS